MTISPKKWLCSQKIFFPIFSEIAAFFEKIVRWKNIQNLIYHKKGYTHFRRQSPASLQKRHAPKQFFAILSENTAFFETTAK